MREDIHRFAQCCFAIRALNPINHRYTGTKRNHSVPGPDRHQNNLLSSKDLLWQTSVKHSPLSTWLAETANDFATNLDGSADSSRSSLGAIVEPKATMQNLITPLYHLSQKESSSTSIHKPVAQESAACCRPAGLQLLQPHSMSAVESRCPRMDMSSGPYNADDGRLESDGHCNDRTEAARQVWPP